MTKIIFAMYNPITDCVEISHNAEIHVSFNCQKCNASVRLDEPSDIAYLTRLAREEPGLYAKLASRDGGLQGYVEAEGVELERKIYPYLHYTVVFGHVNKTCLKQAVFTGCVQSDALQNRFQAGNGSVPNPVGVLSISW